MSANYYVQVKRLNNVSALAQEASGQLTRARAEDTEEPDRQVAQQRYDAMVAEIKALAAEL